MRVGSLYIWGEPTCLEWDYAFTEKRMESVNCTPSDV